MDNQDSQALLQAQHDWYAAINAMLQGDPKPFAEIYSHTDDASYLSAGGGFCVGWSDIWADWQAQAAAATGGQVELEESHINIIDSTAIIQMISTGKVNDFTGIAHSIRVRETSVYRLVQGAWKMIAHQADNLS